MQRAPGEDLQQIFPKGERWCTGEETQHTGVQSTTPDIYLKDINYITYLIHIHSWPIASCSDILQELTNSPILLCRLSHNPSWVALISQ